MALLDPEALRRALLDHPAEILGVVGRRIEYRDSLPSTSDRARALAAEGEPEGTVIIAGEQTRGRGRSERSWHSPPGLGLYMSVLLRPRAPGSEAPFFGLLAAVATAGALEASIKWPNDLLLEGRKVAGILTEARSNQQGIRDLVIGIGVNLNQKTEDFPPEIRSSATSLGIARGGPVQGIGVAESILVELGRWYTLWSRNGGEPVLEEFRSLCPDLVGRRVRVTDGGSVRIGVTEGITADGALRIRSDDDRTGTVMEIRFGEITRIEEA